MLAAEYHIHTNASWCAAAAMTPAAITDAARRRGVGVIGFADHLWLTKPVAGRPRDAARPAPERIMRIRTLLDVLPRSGPHILLGAEADCAPELGIAGGESLAGLDYVVGAYHFSEIRTGQAPWPDTPEALAGVMLGGLRSVVTARHVRVAGHPFFIPPRVYHALAGDLRDRLAVTFALVAAGAPPLLALARDAGIAIELNAKALGPMHRPALAPVYRAAKEIGCRFVLSSDAHRLEDVGNSVTLADWAASVGIGPADFMDVQPRSTPPAAPG